jgi:ribonuclease E
VPYGDDPFVWYDPSEDMKTAPVAANDAPAREEHEQPRVAAEATAAAPSTSARTDKRQDGGEEEIWVELPPAEDRPKRSRRSRGRGRGGAASDDQALAEAPAPEPEAVAAPEPEPVAEPVVAEAPPSGKKPRASRARAKPAAEPTVETAATPEPVPLEPVAAAPTPARERAAAKPREPDPAEISAPPAAPRKGWWRRG